MSDQNYSASVANGNSNPAEDEMIGLRRWWKETVIAMKEQHLKSTHTINLKIMQFAEGGRADQWGWQSIGFPDEDSGHYHLQITTDWPCKRS